MSHVSYVYSYVCLSLREPGQEEEEQEEEDDDGDDGYHHRSYRQLPAEIPVSR